MEANETVAKQIELAKMVTPKDSGKFYRHDGEQVVW